MTKSSTPRDHRTRVAAERRERMRMKLVEAALAVVSDVGTGISIDEVIAEAGVSRGTFYNYFRTPDELVGAVGDLLSKELIAAVESAVADIADPVAQIGTALRLYLHAARKNPRFAAFIWRAGFTVPGAQALMEAYVPAHVKAGVDAGVFSVEDPAVGKVIVGGLALAATFALSTKKLPASYPEQIARHALLALGASPRHADKAIARALPELRLPAGSLLASSPFTRRA